MSWLLTETRTWVSEHYGRHANHLFKAEEWLRHIHHEATEAMLLATLTHDMERAFPGPDSPKVDPSKGPADPIYNTAHAERSARIVSSYLRTQETTPEHKMSEEFIEEVTSLIRAHEFGGWPEANWVQAADSLSFLEVNVDYFIEQIGAPGSDWTPTYVHDKFVWMYSRIQIPQAKALAAPLRERAIQKLQNKLRMNGVT
jgi:hypothetical protein